MWKKAQPTQIKDPKTKGIINKVTAVMDKIT